MYHTIFFSMCHSIFHGNDGLYHGNDGTMVYATVYIMADIILGMVYSTFRIMVRTMIYAAFSSMEH
jgi:hypothetical protein